jgi:short-subunit dehydrogenase
MVCHTSNSNPGPIPANKSCIERRGDQTEGGILVNNAGYGLLGAIEETSSSETKVIFDTKVFGSSM